MAVTCQSTPRLFYACFYDHARRLYLEKLLYLKLSRIFNSCIGAAISFLGRTRFRIHGAFWKYFTKKCSKPLIFRAALTQGFVEAALQAAHPTGPKP